MAAGALSHVPGGWRWTSLCWDSSSRRSIACPAGAEPLEYEGLREHYLREVTFRGQVEHRNSQYATYAAACMRGGMQLTC